MRKNRDKTSSLILDLQKVSESSWNTSDKLLCQYIRNHTHLSCRILNLSELNLSGTISSFCRICGRGDMQYIPNCFSEYLVRVVSGRNGTSPQIHRCPFGVLNACMGISDGKGGARWILVGNGILTPVDEIQTRKSSLELGVDPELALRNLLELPIVKPLQIQKGLRILQSIVNNGESPVFRNRREMRRFTRLKEVYKAFGELQQNPLSANIESRIVEMASRILEAESVFLLHSRFPGEPFFPVASWGDGITKKNSLIWKAISPQLWKIATQDIVRLETDTPEFAQILWALGGSIQEGQGILTSLEQEDQETFLLAIYSSQENPLWEEPNDDFLRELFQQISSLLRANYLERRNQENTLLLSRLNHTMSRVNLCHKEDEILNAVQELVLDLLEVPISVVLLKFSESDSFQVNHKQGHYGISQEEIDNWGVSWINSTIQKILEQGSLVHWDKSTKDDFIGENIAEVTGFKALLAVPLIAGAEKIGVFFIADQQSRVFSQDNCILMSLLSSHTAAALVTARKLEEEHAHAAEMEILNEVSQAINSPLELNDVLKMVMEKTVLLTKTDACATVLHQPDGDYAICGSVGIKGAEYALERGRLHRLLAAEAISKGKIVIEQDVVHSPKSRYPEALKEQGLVSVACAPMVVDSQAIGTLNIYTKTPHEFTENQLCFLSGLASHAAVAIHKSLMHKENAAVAMRLRAAVKQLGDAFAGGEDLTSTLDMIPRLAKELLSAKASGLVLIDPARKEISHVSWSGPEALRRMIDTQLARRLLSHSIQNDGATLLPSLDDCGEDPAFRTARREGLRSFLSVPISINQEVIGMIGVLKSKPHHFNMAEVDLLTTFASQAAVAVGKARLRDQQRDISETLQRSMLPQELPMIPGLICGVSYNPAVDRALIGGDFYDFLPLPDGKWLIVMGDVCGHGTQAAVGIAMDKYALRAYATEDPRPEILLKRLSETRRIQKSPAEFTTLFCGIYDPENRELNFANAGSPPIMACSSDGVYRVSKHVDPPVGLPFEISYSAETWILESDETLILYTDGLYEAKNTNNEEFGTDRIKDSLIRMRTQPPQKMAEKLLHHVIRHSNGQLKDDIAILIFRVVDKINTN